MDREFLQVVTLMLVSPALTFLIVWLDERRLSETMLERAWPPSSRNAAVFVVFQLGLLASCIALLVHFTRTRRSLVGVLLGVVATGFVFLVYVGVVALAGYVLGIDVFAEN